jgi:lysophospholipase L1-like esterase
VDSLDKPFVLRPALELLLVLALIWSGLLALSAVPTGTRVLGFELAENELARIWRRAEPPPEATARAVGANLAPHFLSTTAAPAAAPPLDEAPQRILILGDSMIDGLLPPLADYAAENGHSVNAVIWYGSRTIDWARGTRLADALRDYRPTFVIFVVGSSELTTRDVEKRATAVRTMLKLVGDRKWIWIGPPNWRTDTGMGALLEREVGAGRYFRSLDLTFERKRDGIHPTLAASRRWMAAVAEWVKSRSAVPIRLAPPQKTGTPRPNARVFAPPSP